MVDARMSEKIKAIKKRVIGMMEERQQLLSAEPGRLVSAGSYWAEHCSAFDYMLGLPEEYFSKIRVHTYHITSDTYLSYEMFTDAEGFRSRYDSTIYTADIPKKYLLDEPEGGIGFHYEDGRFLNFDIARYQRAMNALYRHGVFAELERVGESKRPLILEIGGGYGAVAHHLSNILGSSTHVMVDLPETLLITASYLTLNNPDKKIYVYNSDDFDEVVNSDAAGYDFILIPNWQLRSLAHWRFDFSLNMHSFQEMSSAHVEEYLDFVVETCTGTFYSENRDSEPNNVELTSVSELLAARFDLTEVVHPKPRVPVKFKERIKTTLLSAGRTLGLIGHPNVDFPTREYICRISKKSA